MTISLLIVAASSLSRPTGTLEKEIPVLALHAPRFTVHQVVLQTIWVLLDATTLTEEIRSLTLRTALRGELQTIRNNALVVVELEGSLALQTALGAVVGAANDLALSVNGELEGTLAGLAKALGSVLLAPWNNFQALSRNEDEPTRTEMALKRDFSLAALLGQPISLLALHT